MEQKKIFALCQICQASYNIATLLQSSNNDFYCRDCFKRSFYAGGSGAGDRETEIVNVKGKKFMPHPERYVQRSQVSNLLRGHQNLSVMSLSKRPVRCPNADCSKYISVCTLESHFKHEHKEVPIVSTRLDARCASEFYPRDVRYGTIQCIVLLKVINAEFLNMCRLSRMALPSLHPEEQKPIMILMSSRIADLHLTPEDAEEVHQNPQVPDGHSQEEVFRKGERIIVWLASNILTNLSYTVAVSTMDNEIRQKFFGPMLTLNESAAKVCKEGNCLILTHFHCNGMTEHGAKPLALDVVVHNPE
ncbi:hypothetical protein HUJ04_002785 [Dendroctonus ponderosae]